MTKNRLGCLSLVAALLVSCSGERSPGRDTAYPSTLRGSQTDVYHGIEVADPYRWLEDSDAPVQRWLENQNAFSRAELDRLEHRELFRDRMEKLLNYSRAYLPQMENGVAVYPFNTGLQEQDELRVTEDFESLGEVLVDPAEFNEKGTTSIPAYQLSPDGRFLAYALSEGGSDWTRIQIRSVETGIDEPDIIRFTKFSRVSWSRDGSGFYYSRYPQKSDGTGDGQAQVSVYFHQLGDDQQEDQLIYMAPQDSLWNPYAEVSDDGRWLIIGLFYGYDFNAIDVLELGPGGVPSLSDPVPRTLVPGDQGLFWYMGTVGDEFFFRTTHKAENGSVVAIRFSPTGINRRVVVPESNNSMQEATLVADNIVIIYSVDAHARVRIYGPGGISLREVELPGQGSVSGFAGSPGSALTFYSYTDFANPRTIFSYDVLTGEQAVFFQPDTKVAPAEIVSTQVFYNSSDGTRIPMTLVHRRDMEPDGRWPTVLYGYGGFSVSLLPRFSVRRLVWVASGGMYAVANIRGGGEYGEAWHQAGKKLKKQKVFDDFIAAAEWLIENEYTTPERLAIWGASNGGLLVGAVMNQRPELFAAAVPAVGVMDMLRYPLASANARGWGTEYGLPEQEDEFVTLLAYSPYHNLRQGECYPATLVMADTHDDRVVPWHSYKYAASLQWAQGCDRPTLIRIETEAGHGAGASVSKVVEEYADQWAFVSQALGHQPITMP